MENKNQKIEAGKYEPAIRERLMHLDSMQFIPRFLRKDRTLWGDHKEILLGWTDVAGKMLNDLPEIEAFLQRVAEKEFRHVVLLGMGGSSLAPLVLSKLTNPSRESLKLIVLDTTEPEMIKRTEQEIDLASTLFIVASKSGSTAEIKALFDYFYSRISAIKNEDAGEHFVAITDKGSPLARLAGQKHFLETFLNYDGIGGRFSALSYFGIVPAALAGVNVKEILQRADDFARSLTAETNPAEHPAMVLGAALGELSLEGKSKLMYLLPAGLTEFGTWLEQLLAESTGKEEKGILPMNGYPANKATTLGNDKIIFKLVLDQEIASFETQKDELAEKHPVISITLHDLNDIGKEFLRWEIATAVAGSVLSINPFDQPNVEESKNHTKELLKKVAEGGTLEQPEPSVQEELLTWFGDKKSESTHTLVETFFAHPRAGEYIALLGYLPEDPEVHAILTDAQQFLQKRLRVPVAIQYGPRYLHSTGQFYKGGTLRGLFVQLLSDPVVDIQVPGHDHTFGMLKRAQAFGDRQALLDHGKKVLLVDTGKDIIKGLKTFREALAHVAPVERRHRKPIYSTDKNVKTRRTDLA